MRKIFYLLLLCLFPFIKGAVAYTENKLNTCKVDQYALNNYEPKIFHTGNNLLRRYDETELFCGQKILLKLKLLDQSCVPISDARVYIWQVGCDGKYPYVPLKENIEQKMLNLTTESTFVGSGTGMSNNLGNLQFITIRPSTRMGHGYISIRVEHSSYGTFNTQLKITNKMIQRFPDYDIVEARITMPWENMHRHY